MGKSGRNGETGAMTTIEFKDYSAECKEEIESRVLKALTMCGMVIERAAKGLATVDTGLLRNSITWALAGKKPTAEAYKADKQKNGVIQTGKYSGAAPNDDELSVFVGTNVEYAPYVELGTAKQKAKPFLKPAAMNSKSALSQCFQEQGFQR